jgi:putative transposase
VKLVAQVKLVTTAAQKEQLLAIMSRVNEACDWFAEQAFRLQSSDKFRLQADFYPQARVKFGISSQYAIRAIAKVCDSYKLNKKACPTFRPYGAIVLDHWLYTFKSGTTQLSILTLDGRIIVPTAIGEYQNKLLEGKRGQADLIYRDGEFYLYVSVESAVVAPVKPANWLGVDLGIINLAVDSDGVAHSGGPVTAARKRIAKLRAGLQFAGTKSAKRHLKKLRHKESRFHSHTNHVISKEIVRKAKDTSRGIAVEDLTGITRRVTVGRAQRSALHSWSFYQLRSFIEYKALLSGVAFVKVDPRNTSRTCPECGCVDKANRKTQSEFVCIGCGFTCNADWVGARNIAAKGPVIDPIAEDVRLGIGLSTSPQLCHLQSLALYGGVGLLSRMPSSEVCADGQASSTDTGLVITVLLHSRTHVALENEHEG